MSEDKMRDALLRLTNASSALLADMRERAILRGDFKVNEGRTVATLDCGTGVLNSLNGALDAARAAIAEADNTRDAGPTAWGGRNAGVRREG